MAKGLDYSMARPGEGNIKAAGYEFVCRYLSNGGPKNITAQEAQDIKNAGLSLVLVWESTANRALSGHDGGVQDATAALKLVNTVGCSDIPAIYFAVDFDASPGDQAAIDQYLLGAASVIGTKRVGVYGGYWVVKRCFDNGSAAWGWQTYAWSGGHWDSRAQLRQIQNGVQFHGDVDIDESIATNFGQWPTNSMSALDTIIANKTNEFRRQGEATVYQIFAIPDVPFFENTLKDHWENVRDIPADWPIDPKEWGNEREKLRPDLAAAQAQLGQAQTDLATANNRITELTNQNNTLALDAENLNHQIDDLRIQLAKCQAGSGGTGSGTGGSMTLQDILTAIVAWFKRINNK